MPAQNPDSSSAFPYELRRKAGEGAMGIVFEAFDRDLGRPVAIKVMREDMLAGLGPRREKEARLRFLQEARAAARLSHPGIATIHRIGEQNGKPHIAMEWLEGEPLESLLAPRAPLPLGVVARIGVELSEALLFVCDGGIAGALDTETGTEGDLVVESLPAEAEASLRAVPSGLPAGIVRLLASLPRPRKTRFEGLDSSFLNLPALAKKLRDEAFDGIVRLNRNQDEAFVLVLGGWSTLSLFSGSWAGVPVDEPWESWASDILLRATVEEAADGPLYASFRLQLADAAIEVPPQSPESTRSAGGLLFRSPRKTGFATRSAGTPALRLEPLAGGRSTPDAPSEEARRRAFAADPATRFLSWLVGRAPAFLQRIGKERSLKHLAEWIPLVARARLHHDLPRPGTRQTDRFDLVTFGPEEEVLHLARRVTRVTPEELRTYVDRVIAAKTARIRTGDVGAALLVSPSFDESVAGTYQSITTRETEKGRSWTFGAIEAATNYEGFVRIGPRRGFHLILVEESPAGFEVVMP